MKDFLAKDFVTLLGTCVSELSTTSALGSQVNSYHNVMLQH